MNSQVFDLCQPFGGVVSEPQSLALTQFLERSVHVSNCQAANISALTSHARNWDGKAIWNRSVGGAGSEADPEIARFKSVCEAAERYSTSIILDREMTIARADELGEDAFRWQNLPRFSEEELAIPGQLFHNFKADDAIRWIPTISLVQDRQVYAPVVMTHLFPRSWTAERFWVPITTGTAVHSDARLAVIGALMEMIERDALALNWLLKRKLKRLMFRPADIARLPQAAQAFVATDEFILYDATTDFGLPTVYVRRNRPTHPQVVNCVGCASDFSFERAAWKALREVMMISFTLEHREGPVAEHPMDCVSIEDGARFMARPKCTTGFDFMNSPETVEFSQIRNQYSALEAMNDAEKLRWIIGRAKALEMDVLISELTCDELREVGLRCFRALIPELMPMSCVTRSRYLGTKRLHDFARLLGLPTGAELSVNPFPQPFA